MYRVAMDKLNRFLNEFCKLKAINSNAFYEKLLKNLKVFIFVLKEAQTRYGFQCTMCKSKFQYE